MWTPIIIEVNIILLGYGQNYSKIVKYYSNLK